MKRRNFIKCATRALGGLVIFEFRALSHFGNTRLTINHILAVNPETNREDAFFQAVMEIAEGKL